MGNRVCYQRATVAEADGVVSNVRANTFEGTTFITFTVGPTPFVVISEDGTPWTPSLPGSGGLGLRFVSETTALDAGISNPGPYRLVQLETPMIATWQQALAARGVSVHAYIPTNAFIMSVSDNQFADDSVFTDLSFVKTAGVIPTESKIEPALFDKGDLRKVNILTIPGAPGAFDAVREYLDVLGATVVDEAPYIERIQAWVETARLGELAAYPHVMWVDQAGEGEPETDMNNIRQMTGADFVMNTPPGFDGSTVTGQVMDSGLDVAHADFQASFLGLDGPSSTSTHGTSVYGIVFGDGTNNANAVGMAPGAHGTFAQYFQGTRYQRASNVANDHGGIFQTHSWGNPVPKDNTYDSYSNENDRVVLDLDVLMLQSMSNCGPGCARREAMAKNIVSVGALNHRNTADLDDDEWGSGASTGPAADGRIKPDLVGPYDSILTTTVQGYTGGFGGTSGATPVVAGAVVLTHDMWNQGVFGAQSTASPAMAKALLIASANTYNPQQVDGGGDTSPNSPFFGKPVKRDIQGWGLPDLMALYEGAPTALVSDQEFPLGTGATQTFTYTPPAGATRVHVTLTWSDAPANPGANPTLVNDLDLGVSVTGATFLGNAGLELGEFSLPLGAADRLNNVENVFLPAVPGQPLTITVTGAAVNVDTHPATGAVDQAFALAVVPLSG